MEIVVSDTNILIDLYNSGLLYYCKQLDLDFRTLDLIIEEIEVPEQRATINEIIKNGSLKVCSLTGSQVADVYQKIRYYNGKCNLSPEDISVMVYAINNHCRLLTGDKTLRKKAILENITVSGILYLTDMLIRESVLEPTCMIRSLKLLLESNSRLPKKLIEERIANLSLKL
ncbi:hypothetical protein [Segatella bryantii]|uniref:hypothetical protein n=1 Tax=Segatella bryantii TaxID=77095 RepID=UPI002430219E|nr:hypothetical protein [Segatella bryantii]